jgi:hypothetical protein
LIHARASPVTSLIERGPQEIRVTTLIAPSSTPLRQSAEELPNGLARISARHSKQAAKQTAETLYDAAQQPEDAGQEPTYCTAEAAKKSHLRLLFRTPAVPIPGTSNRTPADAPLRDLRSQPILSCNLRIGSRGRLLLPPPSGVV